MEEESSVLGFVYRCNQPAGRPFTHIICLKALRYLHSNYYRVYKAISDDSFHCVSTDC